MTPDRLAAIQQAFLAVSEATPDQRAHLLSELAQKDPALRDEVLSLLSHDSGHPDQVLSRPLVPAVSINQADAEVASIGPGSTLGHYTILRALGAGGMGIVYLAQQQRPQRTVALKIIRPGMASPAMLRRMELEAELLGRLHHPGIAHIYEAGRAGENFGGTPYFAMEYIEGQTLTEYAETHTLDTRARLTLILKVCEAVEHAHQKGVIHRDLKPSNILVDSTGQPKVLDFGVARASENQSLHTGTGQLIGTLPYMSPEQVSADPGEIDTRSDVYALGVIFYQLLAGRLPHQVSSTALPEAARIIREMDPPLLGTFHREFRGDIETIAARAMDKDKNRRYQSALGLASEIRRHLAGEPIEAKRDSAIYILRKQLRRYRTLVAGVCLLIIGLSAVSIYAWTEARRRGELVEAADQARDQARSAEALAEAARIKAEQKSDALQRADYHNRIGFAQAAFAGGDVDRLRRLLEGCPESMRGWEWNYLNRISDTSQNTLHLSKQGLTPATVVLSGPRIIYFKVNEGLTVFDAGTRNQLFTIPTPLGTNFAVPAADGSRIFAGTGKKLIAWNAATGAPEAETDIGPHLYIADISHDGRRLLIVGPDDATQVLDAADGRQLTLARTGRLLNVARFSRDEATFATGSETGRVNIFSTTDGKQLLVPPVHPQAIRSLAFDPRGGRLATGCGDGIVRIWSTTQASPEPLIQGHIHNNKVTALAYSPSGDFLATGSTDTTIRLIEARTCEVVRKFAGHTNTVTCLSFTDASTILSTSRDGTVRWWSSGPSPDDLDFDAKTTTIYGAALSHDGKHVYGVGAPGAIRQWDANTLALEATFPAEQGLGMDLEISANDSLAFVAMRTGLVRAIDLKTQQRTRDFPPHKGSANDIALCERRGWIISGGDDGNAHICDITTGALVHDLGPHEGGILGVDCSRDGSLIATGGRDNLVRLWSGDTWQLLATLTGPTNFVTAVAISPDQTTLAASGEDGNILLWPARPSVPLGAINASTASFTPSGSPLTLTPLRTLTGHQGATYCVAFSPDGSRLLSGGYDNTVRLWDVASGDELLTLRGHISSIHAASFSPDGNRILSATDAGGLRIWNAKTMRH